MTNSVELVAGEDLPGEREMEKENLWKPYGIYPFLSLSHEYDTFVCG